MDREKTTGKFMMLSKPENNEVLECMLRGEGYCVERISLGKHLVANIEKQEPEVIFLDFSETKGENRVPLVLIGELRKKTESPLLVKTANGDELLKILALNAGADDVVEASCSEMEILARIEARRRSYQRTRAEYQLRRRMRMDDLEVDDTSKVVLLKGNRVDLTPTEYKILYLLMERPGRVLSNKQIYESIWNMEPIGADNTIAVHVRHIREKIEENPKKPHYLQVVWGQGYKVG